MILFLENYTFSLIFSFYTFTKIFDGRVIFYVIPLKLRSLLMFRIINKNGMLLKGIPPSGIELSKEVKGPHAENAEN